MSEPAAWQEVPTLAREIIAEVRAMLGDGILSNAGLMEVAERAIRAGEQRERDNRRAT